MCAGKATRRGRPAAAAQLFNGDLGKRGNIASHTDSDKRNGSVTWSTGAGVARPLHVVFSPRRQERDGVQRWMWRGPRALCHRGGDCETAYKRPEFGGITLSGLPMEVSAPRE
uniref:Uncharacterized protein n=1 Tax=Setaria viridis TaxID=4556 RepID=A0A4V6DB90_SETVI|nr:hypothetical protein SEVIR_2G188900v2 [Setaria viridis]